MSEHETVQADHQREAAKPANPPGLLCFHPLGSPPRMVFFPLGRSMTVIGRSDECAIQVEDDEMSRKHALVDGTGSDWKIGDCGSANGVFVDGRRVRTCALAGGEVVRVGSTFLRFLPVGPTEERGELPVQTSGIVSGPSLDPIRQLLSRAASSDLSVLIGGETGTGKELAARHLHEAGDRREGPFVAVNCAAIPGEILESELFGHVKGAFTDASSNKEGLIRQAGGGTLFLDEVGELPAQSQAKLLRVLQDRQVRPVGSDRAVAVDFRVVCATNQDLAAQMERGGFRQDLFARIAELEVHLPSLEERIEDIPLLAAHFVEKHGGGKELTVGAIERLCSRRWPLNVRGLESAIRRAMLLAGPAERLEGDHFADDTPRVPERSASAGSTGSAEPVAASETPEARELEDALRRHGGDVARAAEELGISQSQLYRRAKKHGIRIAHFRS